MNKLCVYITDNYNFLRNVAIRHRQFSCTFLVSWSRKITHYKTNNVSYRCYLVVNIPLYYLYGNVLLIGICRQAKDTTCSNFFLGKYNDPSLGDNGMQSLTSVVAVLIYLSLVYFRLPKTLVEQLTADSDTLCEYARRIVAKDEKHLHSPVYI